MAYDYSENEHEISIRNTSLSDRTKIHSKTHDTLASVSSNSSKKQNNIKSAADGSPPVQLYVETLLVVDHSVYDKIVQLTGLTNQNSIFQYMRIYLSHIMNGVNQVYQKSLENDPDLMISIRLCNFLFLTVRSLV